MCTEFYGKTSCFFKFAGTRIQDILSSQLTFVESLLGQVDASAAAELNTATQTLRVVSYNVWFSRSA